MTGRGSQLFGTKVPKEKPTTALIRIAMNMTNASFA